jgi:triacylglycerol lipase
MAVICFRGTKQVKDWMTNVKIESVPIKDPRPDQDAIIGNMHKGFHDAYQSVHAAIGERLKDHEDLPLYIAGHSLGGALAVVATWYQSSARLAACYTFGAPRVGNQGLIDRFKTPIYRIVNGPDPVPFVPPSGATITALKSVLRVIGSVFPFLDVVDWAVNRLIRIQHFRHYGYMRYLSVAEPGPDGDYPKLQLEFSLSSMQRLSRFVRLYSAGTAKRLDKYHNMSLYRDKLRAQAIKRNT